MTQARKMPLKRVARINARDLPDSTDPDLEFRYVDIAAVGRGALTAEPAWMRFADAPSRARRLVGSGDVIISTVRTYLRAVLPIKAPSDNLVASTGFAALTPETDIDPGYLGWCVQADTFIEEVVARSVGVSYPAISPSELGGIAISVPAQRRQRAIAEFLDAETARIDALIVKKRRLSGLIEARFLAHARGLLSGLPVQTTWEPGPYWHGPVASTWKPQKIAWRKITGSGTTPLSGDPRYYDDSEGLPWVTTSELREQRITETRVRVTRAALNDFSALRPYPPGTVLLAMYGATVGRVGILGVHAATNQACCALFGGSGELDQGFLYWWLHVHREDLMGMAYGAGQPNIGQELVRSLRVPAPDVKVQREVATRLDLQSGVSRRCTAVLDRQIALLQERRQALITAAVTGELAIPAAV